MKNMVLWAVVVMVLFSGCVEPPNGESSDHSQTVDVVDDAKADSGRWKARAAKTSVWFDTRIVAQDDGTFQTTGRLSRNIDVVAASLQDGTRVEAKRLSARRFSLTFDDHAVQRIASGERIIVRLGTSIGELNAMARFAPRLGSFEGDDAMFVLTSMTPVLVGTDVQLRGRVAVPGGWSLDVATSDVGWEGDVRPDPTYWVFDFPIESITALLDRAPLSFLATDIESQSLVKQATVRLRLVQLGISDEVPEVVWPLPECEDAIADCLDNAPYDTGSCGYLNEVAACFAPSTLSFVNDLETAIEAYYAAHEREIAGREGRTLDAALTKISPFDVGLEEDNLGSFAGTRVLYHPGVIFRQSNHLWYGVYDKNGKLLEIKLINDSL